MKLLPVTREAYQLLQQGSEVLSWVESNGIKVDERQLNKSIEIVDKRIGKLTNRLKQDKVYRLMKKRYGEKVNLGSRPQIATVLFDDMGIKYKGVVDESGRPATKSQRYRLDESILSKIDLPFAKDYLEVEGLRKIQATYLSGLVRETINGFVHPSINLNGPISYRSSEEQPNLQNLPRGAKLVRKCFIPRRKDWRAVEIDYGQIEVRVAACYCKDPVLIDYVLHSPPKDMHRDMAMQIFMLKEEQVTKEIRNVVKGMFVFAEFYGDYYIHAGASMWEAAKSLALPNGTTLLDHLTKKGITKPGKFDPEERPRPNTFERYVKEVEEHFWGVRFKVYAKARKRWFEEYLKTGGFNFLTGFRSVGLFGRNDVSNHRIQGAAFHCLLWSMIRIWKKIIKTKMRAKIVNEVHDSIWGDVHKDEVDDFVCMATEIMTEEIRKVWKWLIVPLTVEAEVAPDGRSWWYKEKYKS